MFQDWQLRNKILFPIAVVCMAVFAAILLVVRTGIEDNAAVETRRLAEEISARYAAVVRGELSAAMDAAKVLAAGVASERAGDKPNRAAVAKLLHKTLAALPEVFGVWTAWEPDAFDGRDREFVKADALHEETGRFLPYVIRGASGVEETHTTASLSTSSSADDKWYSQPLKTNKTLLVEPTEYEVAGKKRMMVSACVPMTDKGKGVAGLDISLEGLQKLVSDIAVFGTGYGALLSDSGMIVAHKEKGLIGKQAAELLDEANRKPVTEAIKSAKSLVFFQKSPANGEEMLYSLTPVRLEGVDGAWSFVVAIPKDAMMENARHMQMVLLWLCLGGLAVLIAAVFLIARAIVRPVTGLARAAQAVAGGELDHPIALRQRDEIGRLAQALRDMVASLRGMIAEADEKTRLAGEESARAAQAGEAAEAARQEAERAKTEGMLHAAARLEDVVDILSSASDELAAQVEQSSRGSEEQNARVAETATAMEEMNATVLEVARNAGEAASAAENARTRAEDGAGIVANVIAGIGKVQTQATGLKADMTTLGQQAEGIGNVLNVISDIADQTNLLALNAAIEAARAGEAGRGFAVVADEVRKLAEKTMVATKEVGDAIRSIQEGARKNIGNVEQAAVAIDGATDLARQAGESLQGIVALVETTSEQVRSIATAAEQQSATSEEINRSIEAVSRISSETADAMSQSSRAVTELAEQAQALKGLIADMKGESGGAALPAGGGRRPALPGGR
jgi:methyl-accepting chemotaxis protein